ncbi:TetR family transcriptional regulator [Ureibacillus xyleni]|uniref:TetR family transcriptional regulator n=1 Tax=Ureibacillus xyleni TaxID=614648 RepID=A0A285TQD1_9BACL|nr:TetR/AcrR family transcriptional regulator [Ureibacillus xyleni]SOC25304.1 TetR family transcriptional regulator [Ureibacillus xyleni]
MSPRNSEQNEQIRNERIHQILYAAVGVYVEKGYKGTEMGEIAEKAGIARGLIYYYFKNKKIFFREFFKFFMEMAADSIQSRLAEDIEALEKLKMNTRFYLEMALNQPTFLKFYVKLEQDLELVFEEDTPGVRSEYYKHAKQPLVDVFKQAMYEGKIKQSDPKVIVNVYMGALTGTLDLFADGRIPKEASEQATEQIINLIFTGIQNKER